MKQVIALIDEEKHFEFKHMCLIHGHKMSDIVRTGINTYLERWGKIDDYLKLPTDGKKKKNKKKKKKKKKKGKSN